MLVTDPSFLKAGNAVCSLWLRKGELDRKIGMTQGGWNTKGRFLTNVLWRPVRAYPPDGKVSHSKGAGALPDGLPAAKVLVAHSGCDPNRKRNCPTGKGIWQCIPPQRNRKVLMDYDRKVYGRRCKIEYPMG